MGKIKKVNTNIKKKITARAKEKVLAKDAWMKDLPTALKRNVKGGKLKPKGVSEATIQSTVEDYLHFKGIRFIHIPDLVYRMCNPFTRVGKTTKVWDAKVIKEYLQGVPDIIALKNQDDMTNSCLALELKKKNAKPRMGQKNWALGLTVHYPDTIDKAKELIDEWIKA